MQVLGIDPGSHHTGWGVVRCHGSSMRHVAHGTIHAKGEHLAARLRCIADDLDALLVAHKPDAVAVEGIFHQKNSKSALVLGHARGVILLSISRAGGDLFEYAPAEIKRATTGNGRADKERVRSMVKALLAYDGDLGYDAADALAAALCHAALGGTQLGERRDRVPGDQSRQTRKRSAQKRGSVITLRDVL